MNNMRAQVCKRLAALGYKAEDFTAVDYSLKRAWEYLVNDLYVEEIPDGLSYVWADMAAGLFLKEKMAIGEYFSSPAVKTITEGDISISYKDGVSESERLALLINGLVRPAEAVLAPYRRLAW